ncbi:MAG: hypothetical protein GY810_32425 [Aureispira sp.]|nr:hypothetical protein [Aureispira sp.]
MTESLVITKIIEIQEIESSRVDTLQKCVGNLTDQVSMLKNMVAAQEENFNKLMETL